MQAIGSNDEGLVPLAPRAPLVPILSQASTVRVAAAVQKSRAANTRRTYRMAARKLVAWVQEHHPEVVRQDEADPVRAILPLHTQTLIDFLVSVRQEDGSLPATGTLGVYLSAIRSMHRRLRLPSPTDDPNFKMVWEGLRRERGTRQHGKAPIRWKQLCAMVDAIATDGEGEPRGAALALRDRALLLVGFAGAFRRSELATVRARDVRIPRDDEDPLVLVLAQGTKTRTDPIEVEIPRLGGPYCPTAAFLRWVHYFGPLVPPGFGPDSPVWWSVDAGGSLIARGGPPFRPLAAPRIRDVVRRAAQRAGLNADDFGAHSLRSGAATSAAEAGYEARDVKRLGRWESYATVDVYVRDRRWGTRHPMVSVARGTATTEAGGAT